MTTKLAFRPWGPERDKTVACPPAGLLLQGYVLAYDPKRKATVYVNSHEYGAAFGNVWLYDGSTWKQIAKGKTSFETKQRLTGFWDASRQDVIAWNFSFDYEERRARARGVAISSMKTLETSGDDPVCNPESEEHRIGTFDAYGLFAYDAQRDVTVCFTRRGVWELDAKGVWSKTTASDESIPPEWDDDSYGATWDPVGKRTVFYFFTRSPEREYAFFAWDGAKLERLSTKGLPDKLHYGLFNAGAVLAAHPDHGVVLSAGKAGLFAFDSSSSTWSSPGKSDGSIPPLMSKGTMIWDDNAKALIVGPGRHEDDPGGAETQSAFYLLRGWPGTWELHGSKTVPSPIADSSKTLQHYVKGVWYAVSPRDLRTFESSIEQKAGFSEIISSKDGDAVLGKSHIDSLVVVGGADAVAAPLLALAQDGSVFELSAETKKKTWKKIAGASREHGERDGTSSAWDAANERVVVWGGSVKNRPSNDTLFFSPKDKKWTKPKKPSPLPKDKRGSSAPRFVDFTCFWDHGLERLVRIGYEDVATLEGEEVGKEQWATHNVKELKKTVGSRDYEHFPLVDPKTKETLLLDCEHGHIVRFDLGGCVVVATLAWPDEIMPKQQHDAAAYHAIEATMVFDPDTRTLHAQDPSDGFRRYALDLGPIFEAAAKLGPRKTLGVSPARAGATAATTATTKKAKPASETIEARLYHEKTGAFFVVNGTSAHSGKIGEKTKGSKATKLKDPSKAIAEKKKAGWVSAEKLSLDFLGSLGAVPSEKIKVGKKMPLSAAAQHADRIGGLPAGIDPKKWPKTGSSKTKTTPMGFLFQIATPSLKKHAGVAVFCVTDGTATEDEDNNAAVLITPAEWKKKTVAKAPEGTEVLPMRAITIDKPLLEIDEPRVEALTRNDPDLAAAFERFQTKARVQDDISSKRGGAPAWVQDGDVRGKYRFIAQLDFDHIGDTSDWGLAGCIYVYVHPEEKDAVAFWQYT